MNGYNSVKSDAINECRDQEIRSVCLCSIQEVAEVLIHRQGDESRQLETN